MIMKNMIDKQQMYNKKELKYYIRNKKYMTNKKDNLS